MCIGMKLIIFVGILLVAETIAQQRKLDFVHIVLANGAKTPSFSLPKDPTAATPWSSYEFDQLTKDGKKHQFELGKWLAQRYEKHIGKPFLQSSLYVRSEDRDVAIQSVLTNLAGLLPPSFLDSFTWNLLWQPISVHTIPAGDDKLLTENLPKCPRSEKAIEKLLKTDKYKDLNEKGAELYQYLTNHTGYNVNDLKTAAEVFDIYLQHELNSIKLAPYTQAAFYPNGTLHRIARLSATKTADTDELAKLNGGFLLKEILDRSNGTLINSNNQTKKQSTYIYSTNPGKLATLLTTLKINNELSELPPPSSCLLFEAYTLTNGTKLIEVYFRNSTASSAKAIPLEIPNCGFPCAIDQLYSLYKDRLPSDNFDKECEEEKEEEDDSFMSKLGRAFSSWFS